MGDNSAAVAFSTMDAVFISTVPLSFSVYPLLFTYKLFQGRR